MRSSSACSMMRGVRLWTAAALSLVGALLALATSASAAPQPGAPGSTGTSTPDGSAAEESSGADDKLEQAKALFREGLALRKAGDTERALERFVKSRALAVSVPNTLNAAVCLRELGRFDEALELYEELIAKMEGELTAEERKTISSEMSALRGKVGSIEVRANVAGSLVVDGRARGSLPLSGPLRVLPGNHVVTVIKEGYASEEATVEVAVGVTAKAELRLEPLASSGRLRIDDAALAGAEIFIDGAPVGAAPWEGQLAAGRHVFVLRRADEGTAPTAIQIVDGQIAVGTAALAPLGPEIRITTKPSTAAVVLGKAAVGTGGWQGRLPIGSYALEVSEEGYFPESRTINVGKDSADDVAVELRVDESHERWGVSDAGSAWIDLFGGLTIAPSLGSGPESSCDSAECPSNPVGLGGMVGLRGGWEFPIGLSIELGAGYFRAAKTVERTVPSALANGDAVTFNFTDELSVSGPFAGAGLGYRLGFAEVMELRAHLLVGALFAFSNDTVTGSVSDGQQSMAVSVEGSGESASSADLFVMPSVGLGLRFDGFGVGIEATGALYALGGSDSNKGFAQAGESCGGRLAARVRAGARGRRWQRLRPKSRRVASAASAARHTPTGALPLRRGTWPAT